VHSPPARQGEWEIHSYRYAWAERAKMAGCPERFAQEALGHNSKAVHRAYAKRALMKIPSLEDYEQRATTPAAPAATACARPSKNVQAIVS
jgi:integrase